MESEIQIESDSEEDDDVEVIEVNPITARIRDIHDEIQEEMIIDPVKYDEDLNYL